MTQPTVKSLVGSFQAADFMGDLPLDENGNPVFPPLEELQSLLEEEGFDPDDFPNLPIFDDGDGSENNGDLPRTFML